MYEKEIDKKWQNVWENSDAFKAKNLSKDKKFYGLIEFPYPSCAGLHVGHARAFMGMEAISRKENARI